MKYIICIICILLYCMHAFAENTNRPAIVPLPAEYHQYSGCFTLPDVLTIGGDMADAALKYLQIHGLDGDVSPTSVIETRHDANLKSEEYSLEIKPEKIEISASSDAGLMYAIETLSQILDQSEDGNVQACKIFDHPRMAYRGLMLDVVRCYMPTSEIEKFIDIAAMLKINTLHLHLTDDNGWRIEIPKYPRLTQIGAWRVQRPQIFPGRKNPNADEAATYGGFYTRQELEALVEYAAERNINIIPEIEMPAHAIGAIASYPELACPVSEEFIGVLPGIGGKAAEIIMCAGRDSTLLFVKDVLDEVIDIFPSPYIHLGGDEAAKTRWEKCPLCQQRMREENLADCEALQGWFMDQIIAYVKSKGRKAIGWDEVTYGNPKEDIVVMGWQGNGDVAVDYARTSGRKFIMTPANSTYLIRYQGPQWFEPFTYFGNITLKNAYEYEPVGPNWTDAMRQQLLGIQGSMWTEFCRTPSDVQYMVFPRLIAIADAAWRPEGTRQWENFVVAMDNILYRLENRSINYAKSMYNVQHRIMPCGNGTVVLNAHTERPDAIIKVADNPEMQRAEKFENDFAISKDTCLFLQASVGDTKGQVLPIGISFNKATGRHVTAINCNNDLGYVLCNGMRGSLRNSDFEWAGWYDCDASFVVDLGESSPIISVTIGALANSSLTIALPASISLSISEDGENYNTVKTIEFDESVRFQHEAKVIDIEFPNLNENARFIRIDASNGGHIPDGFPRESARTWLYFDELIVN